MVALELDQRRRQLGLSYAWRSQNAAEFPRQLWFDSYRGAILKPVSKTLQPSPMPWDSPSRFALRPVRAKFAKRAMQKKARQLIGLVQGTSALEAQAVDAQELEDLTEQTTNVLLAGSPRRLWGT